MSDLDKKGFESQELAEIRRIIETNYNVCPLRNKKPSRVYYSEFTGLWHLTSSPTITEYKK